jgi:ketosteroid isomerase-like protein
VAGARPAAWRKFAPTPVPLRGRNANSCAVGRVTGDTDRRMRAQSEESVRGFADAITRCDRDAGVAVCDPEVEFISVLAVSGRAYVGHEGIRQYFSDIVSAWEEWRVEVHQTAALPDGRVVIEMTMHARGRGSGAPLSEFAAHIWTLRDGKLLRNQVFREPDQAIRAAGLSP